LTSEVQARPRLRDRSGGFEFEPHHCFACGELNEQGLKLELHTDPEGSWTEIALPARFQGWDALAHGGIVCTLLDEVMAWSVIGRGTWGVTARLNVAFRRPIPTLRAIRARGWVVDERRRGARTAGEVLDVESGEVLATAEGTFVAVPDDQLEVLKRRYGLRRFGNGPEGAPPDRHVADITERGARGGSPEMAAATRAPR
jgi:acyl-coenzyme A thioesterase PaaI-like protein